MLYIFIIIIIKKAIQDQSDSHRGKNVNKSTILLMSHVNAAFQIKTNKHKFDNNFKLRYLYLLLTFLYRNFYHKIFRVVRNLNIDLFSREFIFPKIHLRFRYFPVLFSSKFIKSCWTLCLSLSRSWDRLEKKNCKIIRLCKK